MWLDPQFWANHFKSVFVKQARVFCDSMINRVLPAFDNIEQEAERIANLEYERLASRPGTGEEHMGDIAETAQDAGIDYYEWLSGVKCGLMNLGTVGLSHLFDQQCCIFHRRQLLDRNEENDKALLTRREFKTRLARAAIKIENLSSWPKIDELRLAANTIKHAEGDSARKLREVRPDLFLCSKATIYAPMSGEGICIKVTDFEQYERAIVQFWDELGTLIQANSNQPLTE